MNEKEYLDISNLEKLKVAKMLLDDCLFLESEDEQKLNIARGNIAMLIGRLFEQIKE